MNTGCHPSADLMAYKACTYNNHGKYIFIYVPQQDLATIIVRGFVVGKIQREKVGQGYNGKEQFITRCFSYRRMHRNKITYQ
jgi:hypothetical protein